MIHFPGAGTNINLVDFSLAKVDAKWAVVRVCYPFDDADALPGTAYSISDDIECVLKSVDKAYDRVVLLGACYGANVVSNWCKKNPTYSQRLTACIFIAHGHTALETMSSADRWLLPSWLILRRWRSALRANSVSLPCERMWKTWSIKEWDELATQHSLFETDSGSDERCVPVRSIYIGARDDPLCPVSRIEASTHQDFLDPNRALVVATRRGGHCAWIDGFSKSTWLQKSLSEILQTCSTFTEDNRM